jgi:hypothetical protein
MKYVLIFEDYIKGGKADSLSIEDIAKLHSDKNGIDYDKMLKIVKKNYEMGIRVETEHTDEKELVDEITRDHIKENPKYYEILKKANLADEL